MDIANITFWGSGIATVMNVAFFAYITTQLRASSSERTQIFGERLLAKEEQLRSKENMIALLEQRLKERDDLRSLDKERHAWDISKQQQEIERLRNTIEKRVASTFEALATSPTSSALSASETIELSTATKELSALVDMDQMPPGSSIPIHEALAKAALVRGDFEEAAAQLDSAALAGEANWQAHMARGVAHANTRGGGRNDLAALRAYNDAIALLPSDASPNTRSKLFVYRGAMLKRLGRLSEAKSDLLLGLDLANSDTIRSDAKYNLAGIYALTRQKSEALACLDEIAHIEAYRLLVSRHRKDYFANLEGDPVFERIVSQWPELQTHIDQRPAMP